MLDKQTKFEIAHSSKNIIDIDEDTSSGNDDEDKKEVKKLQRKQKAAQESVYLKKVVERS